jgi:hypothetical protein
MVVDHQPFTPLVEEDIGCRQLGANPAAVWQLCFLALDPDDERGVAFYSDHWLRHGHGESFGKRANRFS